jgi:SAM-dependent methyltransferase
MAAKVRDEFHSPMTERATFFVDPVELPALRGLLSKLSDAGFSEIPVRERLGFEDLADLDWRAVPIYRAERLAARDPLDLAIDLFLLQGTLPPGEVHRLFSVCEREALIRSGVLSIDGSGKARARASFFLVGDRLIISDHAWPALPHPGYTSTPYDQVMSVGFDSRLLARCTTRRSFRFALDLCTGSGMHALLASTHAAEVLAVDINPRAVDCANFNAQVSGASNLKAVVGDLYDSVPPGETFDLITANPPFVPSPLDTLRFRDGGRSGEEVQKRIVAGLPRHLAPGGIAHMVTELGERDGEPLVHRLRDWLDGAPIDIHVLRLGEYTASKYAIGHAKGEDYQTFLDSIDEWSANLRAQGYVRIVCVVLTFEWSDPACGPPWERVDGSPPPRRPAGSEIDAAFSAERRARRFDWQQALQQQIYISRVPNIALIEARALGNNIPPRNKAACLGLALKAEHPIDRTEQKILERMGERISAPDLDRILRDLGVDESSAITAIRSLLRHRLIRLG